MSKEKYPGLPPEESMAIVDRCVADMDKLCMEASVVYEPRIKSDETIEHEKSNELLRATAKDRLIEGALNIEEDVSGVPDEDNLFAADVLRSIRRGVERGREEGMSDEFIRVMLTNQFMPFSDQDETALLDATKIFAMNGLYDNETKTFDV